MAFVTSTSTPTPVGTGIVAVLFATLVASTLWLSRPDQSQETRDCSAFLDRGRAQARAGDYNLAESLFKQAVQCGNSPKCARAPLAESLNELARIEIAQWHEKEAVAHASQSLDIYKKIGGGSSPQSILSQTTLAEAIYGLNKYQQAGELLRDAISKCNARPASVQNNLLKAQALDELSLVDFANGDHKADERDAVAGYNLRLQNAPQDSSVAESLMSIGWAHFYDDQSQAQLEKAASNLEQAAKIAETKLGPKHPQLGLAFYDLAQIYERQGNQKAAQTAKQRANDIFRQSLRANHPLLSS